MPNITPHLWYDTQANEAATLYTSVFPDSRVNDVTVLRNTPSGDCDVVSFELFGHPFMAISAGPHFVFNPSISLLVRCGDPAEVDAFWERISEGGTELMPLDSYPFSKRYGWTQDRYGLSWQLMLDDGADEQRVVPMFLFVGDVCGRAEDAISHYTSLFPNSRPGEVLRYGSDEEPDREGTIKHATFFLDGQEFMAMDSAHDHRFSFNEAVSLMVVCDSQEEIDHYWEGLSAVPEAAQCGWLKDAFGVSWQVTPSAMGEMLSSGTQEEIDRAMQAMLAMKKFDIAELQRARAGS